MRENSFELFINNTYYLYFSFSEICVYVSLGEARFKMLTLSTLGLLKYSVIDDHQKKWGTEH